MQIQLCILHIFVICGPIHIPFFSTCLFVPCWIRYCINECVRRTRSYIDKLVHFSRAPNSSKNWGKLESFFTIPRHTPNRSQHYNTTNQAHTIIESHNIDTAVYIYIYIYIKIKIRPPSYAFCAIPSTDVQSLAKPQASAHVSVVRK